MEDGRMSDVPIELASLKFEEKFTALDNRLFIVLNRLLQPEDALKPYDASREIDATFPSDSVSERQKGAEDFSNYGEEFLWTL
ncbi:hypothetical protein N7478_005426 [Penicillium angulare]|uniref:uncharacterized protein n=1 Tax=Penicillium angulare TaxID=116970 RepID=UPI00253FAEDD|nr:uncharacterized protein N7478_005426 [Penicillium angulare]KAJ5280054.1 hypothetical protein N7478_005426 [Penicillium angulare]